MWFWLTWNLLSTRDWNSLRCSRLSRASFTVLCQLSICFWRCVTARWYRLGRPPGMDWNITAFSQRTVQLEPFASSSSICNANTSKSWTASTRNLKILWQLDHAPSLSIWLVSRFMISVITELKCNIGHTPLADMNSLGKPLGMNSPNPLRYIPITQCKFHIQQSCYTVTASFVKSDQANGSTKQAVKDWSWQ